MKILQLVPELDEGGVEQHVVWLVGELAKRGHEPLVASAGGRMVECLGDVPHIALPVDKKNLFTGLSCVSALSRLVRRERIDILHAHSRVPAFIAWFTARLARVPWIMTAHALYSLNAGLLSLRHADAVISVSDAVLRHIQDYAPADMSRCVVIRNGLPPARILWQRRERREALRFLFVGRLTRIKGLQFVVEALGKIGNAHAWELDILGSGPWHERLSALAEEFGIADRVHFHGYRADVAEWLAECDCFVCPSLSEGMGLALMQAVQAGVPCLASDIEGVREFLGSASSLVPPGDAGAWEKRLRALLAGQAPPVFDRAAIPTTADMARGVERVYENIIGVA